MRIRRVFCVSGCALLAFLTACSDIEDTASARVQLDAPTTTTPASAIDWHAVKLLYEVRTWNGTVTFWNVARWNDTVNKNAEAARHEAVHRAQQPAQVASGSDRGPAVSAPSGLGPCGGSLPPCYVVQRESGGSYTAFNPNGCGGSGCYGAWQFSGEWACRLGLPCDLSTATPAQQDEAARRLWNGGAGCSNWSAC